MDLGGQSASGAPRRLITGLLYRLPPVDVHARWCCRSLGIHCPGQPSVQPRPVPICQAWLQRLNRRWTVFHLHITPADPASTPPSARPTSSRSRTTGCSMRSGRDQQPCPSKRAQVSTIASHSAHTACPSSQPPCPTRLLLNQGSPNLGLRMSIGSRPHTVSSAAEPSNQPASRR